MINLKAWAIHVLGGVTAEEQERGLRLARPIKAMLADMNESLYKLGHFHHADREAAESVWIDLAQQVPFPQHAPVAPKEDTGLVRTIGVGHLPPTRKTGDLA